jgi:hypothetical protein
MVFGFSKQHPIPSATGQKYQILPATGEGGGTIKMAQKGQNRMRAC